MRVDFLPQWLQMAAVLGGGLRFSISAIRTLRSNNLIKRSHYIMVWRVSDYPLRHLVISLMV